MYTELPTTGRGYLMVEETEWHPSPLSVTFKEKKLHTGEGKANTVLGFLATVTQTASKMGAPSHDMLKAIETSNFLLKAWLTIKTVRPLVCSRY